MKTLFSILLVFFLANKISAQTNEVLSGKIVTENVEGLLKIKAIATSDSKPFYGLNYIMVSVKKGKSGNSSNKQSGKFSLKANETKIISETTINLANKDALKVYLFLKDDETDDVLAKDSLEINSESFDSEVSYIPEQVMELTGLTIDDTKTRLGQSFYEAFFKKYNQMPKKFEGTVTISELPSIGRSTRITVSQDDQVIYAFFSKPDDEVLEAEADRTLANLIEFNRKNSVRSKEFKY